MLIANAAPEIREAILALHAKGTGVRKIARLLKLSRNTVRQAIRQPPPQGMVEPAIPAHLLEPISEAFVRCEGNVVRVQEVLAADHGITIPYSTLTRWVREADLRAPKQRTGRYHFGMGEEMQFDTSPHPLTLNDHPVKAQCAALVLAYSRRAFIQYYPGFTRFEAKGAGGEVLEVADRLEAEAIHISRWSARSIRSGLAQAAGFQPGLIQSVSQLPLHGLPA